MTIDELLEEIARQRDMQNENRERNIETFKTCRREYKDIEVIVQDNLGQRDINRPTIWVLSTLSQSKKPELTEEEKRAGYKRYAVSFIVKAKRHTRNFIYTSMSGNDVEECDPPEEGYLVKRGKKEDFILEDDFNKDFHLIEEDKEKVDLSGFHFTEF